MTEQQFVWLNDELAPLTQARVSVADRGFLYGDGFFETLRVENGRPLFLAEHIRRLRASAAAFRLDLPAGPPLEERLARLLAANGLARGLAAAKILVTRGEAAGLGLPPAASPTLVIWAWPYTPPDPQEYAAGWPVVIFPERRTNFLGGHKSLNYLFYLAARQYALDRGAREALVLETDGLVSEGAATSLICLHQGRLVTPLAASALPGVTVAGLARGLTRRGSSLEWQPLTPAHLGETQGLWLANSLMGAMPVSQLEGRRVPLAPATTRWLQDCLEAEAGRGPEA